MNEKEKIGHLVRFGLALRKVTFNEVIKWADHQILKGQDNQFYFDLSDAKSTNEVIEILHKEIEWDFMSSEIRNLILGYYNDYLKSDPTKWKIIEKELIEYYWYTDYANNNKDLDDFIYYLQDNYSLRKGRFSGSLRMPDYLIENLSKFHHYEELQELLTKNNIEGFEIQKQHIANESSSLWQQVKIKFNL